VNAPLELGGTLTYKPLGTGMSVEQLVDQTRELLRAFGGRDGMGG
jgi:hypothetical protein